MQTVSETTDTTELEAAEKLVDAVTALRTLVERFHAEGQDEMFLYALDNVLLQWEPNARRERHAAKARASKAARHH
jgi:hypothetical protein